jgi:hypothetical protein
LAQSKKPILRRHRKAIGFVLKLGRHTKAHIWESGGQVWLSFPEYPAIPPRYFPHEREAVAYASTTLGIEVER